MGKHRKQGNQGNQATPETETDVLSLAQGGVAEPEETEETTPTVATAEGGDTGVPTQPEAVATTPEAPKPALSLADLVRNAPGLTDEQRAKLLGEAQKIESSEVKSAQAKAMVEFNKELEVELPKWIKTLQEKHKVNLDGRRITVYFPKEGETDKAPKLTSGVKGNGGGGNREGFPSKWGEAVVIMEGKEITHKSPSKAAESLGLQVQGHRDMVDVFENPTEAGTKKELPKIYTVDAVKGSHFRITIVK